MKWAFVDYENTGSLKELKLSDYGRILVFCGPKNTQIKFGSIPTNEFCSIEIIGVSTMGSNNLDFHIAFQLGRFHESAGPEIEFNIISNDHGFNGLISHLKKIGRKCKRIPTKTIVEPPKKNVVLSECASIVITRLTVLDGRKRPRKKAGLVNWIKSQCNGISNGSKPSHVFKELTTANLIGEDQNNIRYNLK